ncbi:MAG: D-alanine--D-alanine ligase family protein [Bacillota bacterium]
MQDKLNVAVIFGGRSAEHAVSLVSAAAVMGALDRNKYNIIPVGITKEGRWLAGGDPLQALQSGNIPGDCFFAAIIADPLHPGIILLDRQEGEQKGDFISLDAVFPVLHGPFGEDGTMQGLLELTGLPYVGAGVLASAASMDKVIMKTLFRQHGLPVGDFIHFSAGQWEKRATVLCDTVEKELGYPCFIKPANMGSSIGISKAAHREALCAGVLEALRYDRKVLVEAFIPCRELECSVLGDEEEAAASPPGEIIPCNDFYDYQAKYHDDRSRLLIPAPLPERVQLRLQDLAVQAFHAVECSGMGRVDFFYQEETESIILNEINTIPGFTSISMYPKLWEAGGISFTALLDRLILIARERTARQLRRQNLLK